MVTVRIHLLLIVGCGGTASKVVSRATCNESDSSSW